MMSFLGGGEELHTVLKVQSHQGQVQGDNDPHPSGHIGTSQDTIGLLGHLHIMKAPMPLLDTLYKWSFSLSITR